MNTQTASTISVQTAVDSEIRIDGSRPLTADAVRELDGVCAAAEDGVEGGAPPGVIRLVVTGSPGEAWIRDLDVALVSKWERVLRRLERVARTTVAVAVGDCGGMALDALLATDYRIATSGLRLLVPVADGATWPGMAVYRLAQQAGVARVRRAVLFGRPIEARQAFDLSLVDELADDLGAALARAAELVGTFSNSELAIRRQLMLDASTTSFEDSLGTHLAACDRALRRATSGLPS